MSLSCQQLQALRAPSALKALRNEELDYHIDHNIICFLDSVPATAFLSIGNKESPDLLEILSPAHDTLPYLYLLLARISAVVEPWKEQYLPKVLGMTGFLWRKLLMFIAEFDQIEIRYAGSKWRDLMAVFEFVTSFGKAGPVMQVMAQAMLRFDPSLGTFTSTHLLFARLCLRTRSLSEARQIVGRDFHSFPSPDSANRVVPCSVQPTSNTFITARSQLSSRVNLNEALEYHLLGALINIGLQDWTQAAFQLEHILSVPTNSIAHSYMLEAYKKWLLVRLLLQGQVFNLPKSVNAAALKVVKNASKHYEGLVDAFKQNDPKKLLAEALEGQHIWDEDGNTGLVRQVLDRHKEQSVIGLSNTYAAVPLDMMASKLNLSAQETQAFITTLIQRGLLTAKIERSASTPIYDVISFVKKTNHGRRLKSEDHMKIELRRQTCRIEELARDISEADRRLELTREYLDHARRSRKAAEQDRSSPEHEGLGLPTFAAGVTSDDDDESVMEDVS